jgi:hypothetical protein
MRKMTGKAAELAAILLRLPLETDFFKQIEQDLLDDGLLNEASRHWIASQLRHLPRCASREALRRQALEQLDWFSQQLAETQRLDATAARQKAQATIESLFTGWRDPLLRRTLPGGQIVEEVGVPLRAIVAYLFGEVAKNFYLIYHQQHWLEFVRRSQDGDRCFSIDATQLPERAQLEAALPWEQGLTGADLLNEWLRRCNATPFDFNRGLSDAELDAPTPPQFHLLEGSNFFRGLALIDFAQALLERAFSPGAVAVRVNAAGQGDFFQVHVDKTQVNPADVKRFLRAAFYRRFQLAPSPEFVELHPGGGACGIRLSRYSDLPQLIRRLQMAAQ